MTRIHFPTHVGPLDLSDSDLSQPARNISADSPGSSEHTTRGVPGDFARLQTGPPAQSGCAQRLSRDPHPSPSAAPQTRGAAGYFRVFDLEAHAYGYRPTCYQSEVRAC
jgi:hypothetical protein